MGTQIGQPDHARHVPELREEVRPIGPRPESLVLVRCQTGTEESMGLSRVVHRRDHAAVGARQRAGAVDHLAQDRVYVEVGSDAQARCAKPGDAVPQQCDLSLQVVGLAHASAPRSHFGITLPTRTLMIATRLVMLTNKELKWHENYNQ